MTVNRPDYGLRFDAVYTGTGSENKLLLFGDVWRCRPQRRRQRERGKVQRICWSDIQALLKRTTKERPPATTTV